MNEEAIFLLFVASLVAALEESVRERIKIAAERDAMIEQNKRLMALLARQNEALELSRQVKPSEPSASRFRN